MRRDTIDLEKVIDILRSEYEIAKGLEYVRHPLSWTVYQVWLMLDEMDKRSVKGEEPNDGGKDD